ncbi:hypothetical protein FB45DRAFT_207638 [Roridomyces roridus]|uniref:Uncharacterized protein n=1 Tax=Roridomyces roridus TaxID=1738132 RepID=A0AAD7CGC8_9AGAR|nr:hypothetical protein FB45DRAFT_207638 [Roridomyces roridus]
MQRNSSNVYSPQFALQPMNSRHNSEETARKDVPPPATSASHDKADAKARRQAAKDLTQSWMDRLQLISVITTFFASTEAGMLQVTTPGGAESSTAAIIQITNAAFLGALVLHIWAAIISFMAAFFLVRYNLKEAKEEELQTRLVSEPIPASQLLPRPDTDESLVGVLIRPLNVWTANPHLEQVGPFQRCSLSLS